MSAAHHADLGLVTSLAVDLRFLQQPLRLDVNNAVTPIAVLKEQIGHTPPEAFTVPTAQPHGLAGNTPYVGVEIRQQQTSRSSGLS